MHNYLRKYFFCILTGTLLVSLAGCGKANSGDVNQKEFAYVPEYVSMDLECNYVNQAVAKDETLFVAGSLWNEQTQEHSNLMYKYNLNDGTSEKLNLSLPDKCYTSQLALNPDGSLCVVAECSNAQDLDAEEMMDDQRTFEVFKLSSENGEVLSRKDITPFITDTEQAYIQHSSVDKLGNLYLQVSDQMIIVLDKDLNLLCDISVSSWIMEMMPSMEGDVYISGYGQEGIELRKIDLETKSLAAPITALNSVSFSDYYTGKTQSFLVNDSNSAGYYDIATTKSEELFQWLDVDVNSDRITTMGELPDGRIWVMVEAPVQSAETEIPKRELIYFTKTKASDISEKEIITYGTFWISSEVKDAVINFNKTNAKYRVTVKNYIQEDYESGMKQFNLDIASANCPDIVDVAAVNFDKFVSKGIFEDLYPYMEKSNLQKTDYLENILKAYEVEGKLYGVLPQFYIESALAKSSRMGDVSGWTLSEMLDYVKKEQPENVFMYGTRGAVFYYCIQNNLEEFIDWNAGKCTFDSDEFFKILEFAKGFPKEANYDSGAGLSEMIRSDKVLLMQNSVGSVPEYQMLTGLFGEEVCFVGYPNNERKGNLIGSQCGCFGISSKSKHKDGAWEFIKYFMEDEYQNKAAKAGNDMGFPIKKSALDEMFKNDMTPTYFTDENGNKIEEMKTSWGYDDFNIDIYSATQEDVDNVKALIESAERPSKYMDNDVMNIITEEAEAFFNDQKSAKDTAAVIQNRIQIYVSENK